MQLNLKTSDYEEYKDLESGIKELRVKPMGDSFKKIYKAQKRKLKIVSSSIELNSQIISLVKRKEELKKLIEDN
jgi:non-canonical (house-cleaning) NTP pyrophosphatase